VGLQRIWNSGDVNAPTGNTDPWGVGLITRFTYEAMCGDGVCDPGPWGHGDASR
jgi:hypothetical protein